MSGCQAASTSNPGSLAPLKPNMPRYIPSGTARSDALNQPSQT